MARSMPMDVDAPVGLAPGITPIAWAWMCAPNSAGIPEAPPMALL